MQQITKLEVLRLYKNLIQYSRQLKFTDPVYFKQRVRTEFENSKSLTQTKDINFAFKKGEALLNRRTVV